MGLRPLLRAFTVLIFALCISCSGGSSKAQMPDLELPEGLAGGATLTEDAAAQAFAAWRDQLPTEPTIPLSVGYQIDAGFALRPEGEAVVEGEAVGTLDLLFYDRERARGDAFLALQLPDQEEPWQLTGTLQFDGFYLRAWGTGNHVPRVDPDRIYASQFDQGMLESTYSSLTQLMPRFIDELQDRGVPGAAMLGRDIGKSVIYLMHPNGLLGLTTSTFHCSSLRHESGALYGTFVFDLREGSHARPILETVLDMPGEMLEKMANRFTIDASFEPHTGLLLSATFEAALAPSILQPDLPNADLHFRLQAQDLKWKVASLDDVLERPAEVDPVDLSALLKIADQFINMEQEKQDVEGDFEFED